MSVFVISLALAAATAADGHFGAPAVAQNELFQNSFATCHVRYRPLQSRKFVIGEGVAPREERCLGQEWLLVTIRFQTFRYTLAKVLLQRDYADGLPKEIGALPSLPLRAAQFHGRDAAADRKNLMVADCVIRKEPTTSFALAGVEAGEASAEPVMAQLEATLAGCSAGTQVRYLTGFQMHEAIVTRMYQLAYAARKPHDA